MDFNTIKIGVSGTNTLRASLISLARLPWTKQSRDEGDDSHISGGEVTDAVKQVPGGRARNSGPS